MDSREFARYNPNGFRGAQPRHPADDVPETGGEACLVVDRHDRSGPKAQPVPQDDVPDGSRRFEEKQIKVLQYYVDTGVLRTAEADLMAKCFGSAHRFKAPPVGREFTALDLKVHGGKRLRTFKDAVKALDFAKIPRGKWTDEESQLARLLLQAATSVKS